ncbi:hypothetical protein AVL62_13495 [Serinicoccus chungangensis]|uniref:Bacterial transcriptional activator domain-containing protein n=1 Tax=Serinicoccus chungangensis TaxID=767452 RepID=A0A0W8IBW2_9MICO|nr:BTAD domain-containing putative transcriptional regulator [Serinicoccus chungangensis]KUG57433.1 hypothetical protein AVL62_13495 [Serinicoccus chungangensis]
MSIGVLGSFSLRVQGQDVSLPAGAQRLVAMLAVRGRIGRSRLAGMLWPEATEHRALASLRTGIWRTNQAAGGLVLSDHGTVRLGLEPQVDLECLVERSRLVLDGQDPPDDDGWEQGTLSAELLEDWDDEWLEPERERLRQLRLHVMDAEARRLARLGRYGLALDLALTALQADELRESAHRMVVEIHLAEGNVSEARRAFEACRELLESELGITPSQDLLTLVEQAVPTPQRALADRELAGIG